MSTQLVIEVAPERAGAQFLLLDTVDQLGTAIRRGFNLAYVSDPVRGKNFFKYVPEGEFNEEVENGLYYAAQDGGYWRRLLDRDTVSPKMWPGGIPNSTQSAHSAIKKALESGYAVETAEDEVYFLSEPVVVEDKPVKIKQLNVKIDHTSPSIIGSKALTITNSLIKQGLVDNSSGIQESSLKVTLDNTTGINKGDLIKIFCEPQSAGSLVIGRSYVITSEGGDFTGIGASDNNIGTSFVATGTTPTWGGGEVLILWDYDPRPGVTNVTLGEINRILYVDGSDVYLDIPLMDEYSSTFNLRYEIYRPKDVFISNLKLSADEPGNFGGLSVGYASPVIEKIEFDRVSGSAGLSIGSCYKANILSPVIQNGYYTGVTTGYGIQDNGSIGTSVTARGQFIRNRRGVDFSGSTPARLGMVSDNLFVAEEASGSGAGTHGGADLITFQKNDFIGGTIGVQVRSPRTYIKANNFKHNSIVSVFIEHSDNVQITDNNCIGNNKIYTLNQSAFVQVNSNTKFSRFKPLIISRNIAIGLRQGFLRLGGNFNLEGLRMTNNDIVFASNSTTFDVNLIFETSGNNPTIEGSFIKDNAIRVERGVYSVLKNVIINRDRSAGDVIYQINDSDFEKWGGAGTIQNLSVDVNQSVDQNNFAHVNGFLKFDVTGNSAAVRIRNLTRSNLSLSDSFISIEGHIIVISVDGDLYIGYSGGGAYNTHFPVGTDYEVNFSIKYKVREGYEFN